MGYIESQEHFINYLISALKREYLRINIDELMPAAWYTEQIYNKGLAV